MSIARNPEAEPIFKQGDTASRLGGLRDWKVSLSLRFCLDIIMLFRLAEVREEGSMGGAG